MAKYRIIKWISPHYNGPRFSIEKKGLFFWRSLWTVKDEAAAQQWLKDYLTGPEVIHEKET